MNYNILKYVVAVAEQGSFTRAAQALFVSQPSLSQSIRAEEGKLGVELFDRSGSPPTLTPAGREYVRRARQLLYMQQELERRMEDFSQRKISLLRIGILPEFSHSILPVPLARFTGESSSRLVQINELSSNDLQDSIDSLELDFIVGLAHPDTLKYHSLPLYDEHIVLTMPESMALPQPDRSEVDLADFARYPFVMMAEGQFLYRISHELCRESGFTPQTVVECYNLPTAMYIVRAGVGISLFPDLMLNQVDGLCYYRLRGREPRSQIAIVYPSNRYLTREAGRLIELIQEHCAAG